MKRITKKWTLFGMLVLVLAVVGVGFFAPDVRSCLRLGREGFRAIADQRDQRFLGKVRDYTLRCRAPDSAQALSATPWVDWTNYWGTGDETSEFGLKFLAHLGRNGRGVDGALLDLEYQRIELINSTCSTTTRSRLTCAVATGGAAAR
jgi:hypothetical protein